MVKAETWTVAASSYGYASWK